MTLIENLAYTKLVMSLTIWIISSIAAVSAVCLTHRRRSRISAKTYSGIQSLTTGIFFALYYFMLNPEVESEKQSFEKKHKVYLHPQMSGYFQGLGFAIMFIMRFTKLKADTSDSEQESAKEGMELEILNENTDLEEKASTVRQQQQRSSLFNYSFFTTLISIHSVVEGLPLGLKKTVSGVAAYSTLMIAHKFFEILMVVVAGSEQSTCCSMIGSLWHAFGTPLGAGIGYALTSSEFGIVVDFIVYALMAVCTGAFSFMAWDELYKLFTAIEYRGVSNNFKTSMVIVGLVTAGVLLWIIEEHGHVHGGDDGF